MYVGLVMDLDLFQCFQVEMTQILLLLLIWLTAGIIWQAKENLIFSDLIQKPKNQIFGIGFLVKLIKLMGNCWQPNRTRLYARGNNHKDTVLDLTS